MQDLDISEYQVPIASHGCNTHSQTKASFSGGFCGIGSISQTALPVAADAAVVQACLCAVRAARKVIARAEGAERTR